MTSIGQRKGILWTVFRVPRRYVVMQEDFSEGIGPSSVLEKTRGMERTLTNHKENGTKMPILWFSTLKKVDTRYSEASARSTEESWRRKEEDLRFTVLRNLQTRSFFIFAQFTGQISSVSTERYRVGVKTQLESFLVNHFRMWTNLFQERTASYRKSWIRKKWILWYVIQRGLREPPETACMIILDDSKDWI